MNNIKTLDSYFEGFGEYAELLKSFKFEEQECELCGSKDFTRIRDYDAGSSLCRDAY